MKVTKRKVMATVIACLVACMMFAMPVLAASSTYFSKSTTKLNAMGGGTSKTSTFSSGSVLGSNQSITQVKLALNVASGTDPYTIYVKSPEGTLTSITGSTSSTILYSNVFNGENPYGTLLNHNSNIKYKIKETTNLFDVYDSANDENSHRNKFTGSSYSSAEKAKFNTNAGQEFYLVVYNSGTSGSGSLNENNFLLGVGKPVMMGAYVNIYGSSMTAGSASFSGTQYFALNTSDIPTTAQVESVSLSGVTLSKIDKWRLLPPGSSSWKQSSTRGSTISYTYLDDSNFNTLMYGTWGFSLKTDSSTLTFTPRLSFQYYYEMGD